MAIWTDLNELKQVFDIPTGDHSQDRNLLLYVEWAGSLIENLLDRPLVYRERTEYYPGTGTQKLLLKARPVFTTPTPQVWMDEGGFYGQVSGSFGTQTQLTYGTDFGLVIDDADGVSKSGILVRRNALWPKPTVRIAGLLSPFVGESYGTIKITYTAGYTVDTLPGEFRYAVTQLIAKFLHLFPLGLELSSESYEDRSISWLARRENYLIGIIRPLLWRYRNYNF